MFVLARLNSLYHKNEAKHISSGNKKKPTINNLRNEVVFIVLFEYIIFNSNNECKYLVCYTLYTFLVNKIVSRRIESVQYAYDVSKLIECEQFLNESPYFFKMNLQLFLQTLIFNTNKTNIVAKGYFMQNLNTCKNKHCM